MSYKEVGAAKNKFVDVDLPSAVSCGRMCGVVGEGARWRVEQPGDDALRGELGGEHGNGGEDDDDDDGKRAVDCTPIKDYRTSKTAANESTL